MTNPEIELEVPAVSDKQVKDFLAFGHLPKPYGGKLVAHTRAVLDVVAKDIEIRVFHGQREYTLDDHQFEAFAKLFPMIPSYGLRRAVDAFARDRLEDAIERQQAPGRGNFTP